MYLMPSQGFSLEFFNGGGSQKLEIVKKNCDNTSTHLDRVPPLDRQTDRIGETVSHCMLACDNENGDECVLLLNYVLVCLPD